MREHACASTHARARTHTHAYTQAFERELGELLTDIQTRLAEIDDTLVLTEYLDEAEATHPRVPTYARKYTRARARSWS